jgi:hypothetical protein
VCHRQRPALLPNCTIVFSLHRLCRICQICPDLPSGHKGWLCQLGSVSLFPNSRLLCATPHRGKTTPLPSGKASKRCLPSQAAVLTTDDTNDNRRPYRWDATAIVYEGHCPYKAMPPEMALCNDIAWSVSKTTARMLRTKPIQPRWPLPPHTDHTDGMTPNLQSPAAAATSVPS